MKRPRIAVDPGPQEMLRYRERSSRNRCGRSEQHVEEVVWVAGVAYELPEGANRIRPLLQRYADFDFRIDTQEWAVRFSRTVDGQVIDNIKVSRGEENIFVWCFFLAIVQLALDGAEAYPFNPELFPAAAEKVPA